MNRLFAILLLLHVNLVVSKAQHMPRVRQTIDTLTSNTMHGRGYIKQGDQKAATYIQNRFQEMGLQPINGSSYLQKFSFPVNIIISTPRLRINGTALTPGTDFVANAATSPGKGKLKVLELDSLVFSDTKAAAAFFRQDLTTKAIAYTSKDQKRITQLPKQYQEQLQKARLHLVLQPNALLTAVALQQQPVPVLEVLQSKWPKQAKEVEFEVSSGLNPKHEAQNVIGVIPGTEQPDSVIMLTAHYDHLGGQGDVYFPGANDNASGTAMLLELAQHYSQPQNRPKYSIAFVAFAAEEAGLLGSLYYVKHPLFPLQQIRFLVNLDLLGTGDEGLMVVNGKVHEQEFQLLQHLNKQHHYLKQIKSRGKAANSDHYPFSEAGVPAFFFYTLGGTAAYHNTQDHAQQLPLTKFQEVFKLITDFVRVLGAG